MGRVFKVAVFATKVIALMAMCVAMGIIFLFLPMMVSYFLKFPNYVGIPLSLLSMVVYLIVLQYIYEKAFTVYK